MVSVSIFVVVAVIATGALITASDINRKAQAIKLAVDNVNFALNKMAFEIKLGGVYDCGALADLGDVTGTDCSSGESIITFKTVRDDCANLTGRDDDYCKISFGKIPVSYKRVVDASGRGEIQYSFNEDSPTNYIAVTSPEVNITKLNFIVRGYTAGVAPRVEIEITGIVADGTKYKTEFNIKTNAANRII